MGDSMMMIIIIMTMMTTMMIIMSSSKDGGRQGLSVGPRPKGSWRCVEKRGKSW